MYSKIIEKLGKYWYVKAALILIAALFPVLSTAFLPSPTYIIQIGCFILIYIIAVSGLDILFGYCGQISLGHAGFFAIGAYGSAILTDKLGIHVLLATVIACIAAALISVVIAFPAAKLKFHFLSLATIAFGEIIYSLCGASPGEITGNFRGYFPAKLILFGKSFSDDYTLYFYFVFIILAICLLVKTALVNSKTGRAFTAIRENVVAANGMGINVRKYKVMAFATSAFFVALSGALYGHFVNYISPGLFLFDQSVMFLTMLLFGGSGCFWGPIAGVVAVQIINEFLRYLEKFQTMFYGVFLLVVILFMPGGIVNLRFTRKKKIEKKEVSTDVEG